MKTENFFVTALALTGVVIVSCTREELPSGSFGSGTINPVVSTLDMKTKSGLGVQDGECIASYKLEGVADDALVLNVYEFDNNDLPEELSADCSETKGMVVTSDYINQVGEEFLLNAWLESSNRYYIGKEGFSQSYCPEDASDFHFMKSALATRGSSSWELTTTEESPYWNVWRNKVPTNFWAVYPTSDRGARGLARNIVYPADNASDEEQKRLSVSYTESNRVEINPDLCFAYCRQTWDGTKASNSNNVELNFNHALAAVYFDFFNALDAHFTFVNQCSINGVYSSGECNVTATDDKQIEINWTNQSNPKTFSRIDEFTFDEIEGAGRQKFYDNEHIFMMVPQTLPSDAMLNFSSTIGSERFRASIAWKSDGTPMEWKPGKKYLYKIAYSYKDPSESDWNFEFGNGLESATQYFTNTVSPSSPVSISVVSTRTPHGESPEPAAWKIDSIKLGSAPAVEYNTAAFSGIGGLTVTSSADAIILKADAREGFYYGTHNWWTNEGGISGDTQGDGWSPKSWGSDGENKGVIDLSSFNFQSETFNNPMTTANCYVIRHAGTYKFPLVYGNGIVNGEFNVQAYAPYASGDNVLANFVNHLGNGISNPFIEYNTEDGSDSTPYLATAPGTDGYTVLWQDEADFITINGISKETVTVKNAAGVDETFNVSYLTFTIPQNKVCQNNAVIAVKDANGAVMWSWHIWVTNNPALIGEPIQVVNHDACTFDFFPLYNLGWIDAERCDAREDVTIVLRQCNSQKRIVLTVKQPATMGSANGCYYQFGRKDPVSRIYRPKSGTFTQVPGPVSIETAICNPNIYYTRSSFTDPLIDWCNPSFYNLWTGTLATETKTVYDPSPIGYKVPSIDAFTGFTFDGNQARTEDNINKDGAWDKGWNYMTNSVSGQQTIYFPASGLMNRVGVGVVQIGEGGAYWSCSVFGSRYLYLSFGIRSTGFSGNYPSYGFSVRPVVEQ